MANRINLTLGIKADISQATTELHRLQTQLDNIFKSSSVNNSGVSSELVEAANAAQSLKLNLEKAFNANTGKIDLFKFNQNLKASGMTLGDYQNKLALIGPAGEQAFNSLATAIQSAEIPLRQTRALVDKFFDGLKNTAMWTLQSNAIHAVQSALSGAYNYAQKLNKGLTDIAIVSDLNTQQLTEFAKTANRMAKDLSASTSDIVSGALIYYQAGLSDEEVIKRTETTIKLAQTSGESAEQISSYMTAIWNNFYDGSKSVEYYADAISYLGAVTAASNADIAEGMQAFSAVADTVGLSFEYGASALTLLRDITQQSASTIGNSLKTIFARLSSVAQGETLEDGVDYTKYSKALDAVGVSVLDVNGNLRSMDEILDNLAGRWDALSDAQKVALAQTVGGVRQYNNLISLMDNYERFQELVVGAGGSTGYLQNQTDIYAESWEAASNRATAAWQEFYQTILNDKFFISLKNIEAGFASFITSITKGLGGAKGVISSIGVLLTSVFGQQLSESLRSFAYNVGFGRKELEELQKAAFDQQMNYYKINGNSFYTASLDEYRTQLEKYNQLKSQMSDFEREYYKSLLDTNRALLEQAKNATQASDALQKRTTAQINSAKKSLTPGADNFWIGLNWNINKSNAAFTTAENLSGILNNNQQDATARLASFAERIQQIDKAFAAQNLPTFTSQFREVINILKDPALDDVVKVQQLQQMINGWDTSSPTSAFQNSINLFVDRLLQLPGLSDEARNHIKQLIEDLKKSSNASYGAAEGLLELNDAMHGVNIHTVQFSDIFTDVTQGIQAASRALMGLDALESMITGFVDGTITYAQALTSLSSALIALIPLFELLGKGAGAWGVGGWVGVITAAIWGIVKGAQIIEKIAYNISTQKVIDDLTEKLKNQDAIIKDLSTSYSNLTSTVRELTSAYDALAAAADKYGENSPQYLLALEEYNSKLDDLAQKYGTSIFEDPNATVRKINETALADAQWASVQFAKLEKNILQGQLDQAHIRNSIEQLTGRPVLQAATDNDRTIHGYTLDDGRFVEDYVWEENYAPILRAISEKLLSANYNGKSIDLTKIEGWNEVDDATRSYITKRFRDYVNAIESAEDHTVDFGTFAKNSGAITQIFDWAQFNNTGITNSQIVDVLNALIPTTFTGIQRDNYLQQGIDRYLAEHEGYTYNTDTQTFYDANNKPISESEAPLEEDLIRISAEIDYLNRLRNNDADLVNQIIQDLKLSDNQIASWQQFLDDLEQFKLDATKAEGLGLDVAEFKEYVEYLKTVPQYAQFAQQELDEIAIANMRINRGVESLNDDYDDWMRILVNANREGMDWAKHNIEYKNAMEGVKQALADIANVDISEINDSFLASAKNLRLIEAAATGDEDAIDDLIHAIAIDFASALENSRDDITRWEQELIDGINEVNFNDIEIGTTIDDQPFYDTLKAMIAAGAVAVDDINTLLATIGYAPIVDYQEVELQGYQHDEASANGTITYRNPETGELITAEIAHNDAYNNVTQGAKVKIPIIKGSNVGGKATVATASSMSSALAQSKFTGGVGRNVTQSNKTGGSKKGGGSSRTNTKDMERYHEITSQLEQTSHALDMTNAAEKEAYGPDKLALIDEKIKLLEQETEQYKQLQAEAQGYYDADRAHLASAYGAQFNPDGSIANYDAWYRQFLDKYNSGNMDDDAWSSFEDAIKKYEDSLKHLNDAEKNIQDNLIDIFNQKLEKVEYKLKYLNKLIDQDIDYLDYLIKQLDKDMYDTADVLALMGEKINDVLQQATNERDAIAEILGGHGLNDEDIQAFLSGQKNVAEVLEQVGQLTEKEISDLQQHQSALLDYNETLIQIREESYEKISESISEFNDQIERQIDIIDDLDGLMSHYKNIIDIVGKDVLGVSDEMLENMDKLAITAAQSSLEISTNQLEHNREILEDLYKQRNEMAETASDEDKRLMDKEIQKQEDEVRRLTESWATSWENALKVAETAFKNSIERTTDAFSKAMAGSLGSLDNLQEAFDQQKQLNERYLPTYQRIYELNKLTRDVNNAIDNTSNIAGKERLLKLQQEILDRQQSGAEITEYEVGMLQRRLELEQARIAMEDAQNAKNMVRMTRDNEGNWSYVYTADASRMAEAQQNYEDKLYDLKKYNQESMAAFEEAMWKAVQDYKDSIADLNLTDEERLARIKAFQEEWVAHNARMLNMALNDANWIIGEYNAGIDDLQDNWSDLISGQITDYDSLGTMMKTFEGASTTMIGNVGSAFATWKINHERIFEAAGSSVDTFAKQVEKDMKDAGEAMLGNGDDKPGLVGDAKQLGEDLEKVLGDILTYLDEWTIGEDGYFAKIDTITNKHEAWYNSIQNLIEQYKGLKTAAQEAASVPGPQGSGSGDIPNSGSSNGNGGYYGGNPSPSRSPTSTSTTPVWTWTEIRNPGGGLTTIYGPYARGSEPSTVKKPGWQWRKLDQNKNPMGDWYYAYGITSNSGGGYSGQYMVKADTGMYTGSWGPEGKLAMLHEKELVLNKQDTANMLATVGFVRDITQMLSLNASVASAGLGSLMMGNVNAGSSYLDQNVTIHAEFPNATNHSEIEEAFNNLIGLASQYAGRKQ